MLKKTIPVNTPTAFPVADSLSQGDRRYVSEIEKDINNGHKGTLLRFILPASLVGTIALLCLTAIHMEEGQLKLNISVKDWFNFQAEIRKNSH